MQDELPAFRPGRWKVFDFRIKDTQRRSDWITLPASSIGPHDTAWRHLLSTSTFAVVTDEHRGVGPSDLCVFIHESLVDE